jgi:hypothetical protein
MSTPFIRRSWFEGLRSSVPDAKSQDLVCLLASVSGHAKIGLNAQFLLEEPNNYGMQLGPKTDRYADQLGHNTIQADGLPLLSISCSEP